jgi:hypothetical protein
MEKFERVHFCSKKMMLFTYKSQKVENLCNNPYFLLFFAKKSKQKRLRLTKNAGLLLPRSGGAKKNSPHYRAEAVPRKIRLAQTVFGFIRLHSSKTCIFLRPVLPHLGECTSFQISKYFTKTNVYSFKLFAKKRKQRCKSMTILPRVYKKTLNTKQSHRL